MDLQALFVLQFLSNIYPEAEEGMDKTSGRHFMKEQANRVRRQRSPKVNTIHQVPRGI